MPHNDENVFAIKFSEESIFCNCDCHSKAGLKHPEHCFFCSELHNPKNYPDKESEND